MTQARSREVSHQDTRYYHLISRCVRRAYLCGEDVYTKQSFEHRRQWMVELLLLILTNSGLVATDSKQICSSKASN